MTGEKVETGLFGKFGKKTWVEDLDVSGYKVVALDGAAGTIEQVLYWSDARTPDYVVVDTGGWFFSHKSVLSISEIEEIDADSRSLRIGMSRKQIREAPEFLPCI